MRSGNLTALILALTVLICGNAVGAPVSCAQDLPHMKAGLQAATIGNFQGALEEFQSGRTEALNSCVQTEFEAAELEALLELGRYRDAWELARDSRFEGQISAPSYQHARALSLKGKARLLYADGSEYADSELEIAGANTEKIGTSKPLQNMQRLWEARKLLAAGANESQNLGAPEIAALSEINLAYLDSQLAKQQAALKHSGLQLSTWVPANESCASCDIDLAVRLATKAGQPSLQVKAYLAAIDLAIGETADPDSCPAQLSDESRALIDDLAGPRNGLVWGIKRGVARVDALIRIGEALICSEQAQARSLFETALNEAKTLDYKAGISQAHGELARLYALQGLRLDKSLCADVQPNSRALLEQAVDEAQAAVAALINVDRPDLMYRWDWQLGKIYQCLERKQYDLQPTSDRQILPSVRAYEAAVRLVQDFREDYGRDFRSKEITSALNVASFKQIVGPLFTQYAELRLRYNLDLAKTLEIVEALREAEIRDYYGDDCVITLGRASVSLVDALKEHKNSSTSALYTITLPDRLEIVAEIGGTLQQFTVKHDEKGVVDEVGKFRNSISGGGKIGNEGSDFISRDEYLQPARHLYDWIFKESGLRAKLDAGKVKTLIIVADGALRTVPWGAMIVPSEQDPRHFLVEDFAIGTAPGIKLLDLGRRSDARPKVLLAGLTTSNLKSVPSELDDVRSLFKGQGDLHDSSFTVEKLKQALKRDAYQIVHIASHAQFGSDLSQSYIEVYDGKMTLDQLEQLLKISKYRTDPVEILFLSGCQTAVSGEDESTDDERAALGLAGVAVKSGARSVIGSLWPLTDQAAKYLVYEFYHQLKDGGLEGTGGDQNLNKATALQRAQLCLMNHQSKQINCILDTEKERGQRQLAWNRPYFWSSLVVIGNWQ